jgi:hypothetical protein
MTNSGARPDGACPDLHRRAVVPLLAALVLVLVLIFVWAAAAPRSRARPAPHLSVDGEPSRWEARPDAPGRQQIECGRGRRPSPPVRAHAGTRRRPPRDRSARSAVRRRLAGTTAPRPPAPSAHTLRRGRAAGDDRHRRVRQRLTKTDRRDHVDAEQPADHPGIGRKSSPRRARLVPIRPRKPIEFRPQIWAMHERARLLPSAKPNQDRRRARRTRRAAAAAELRRRPPGVGGPEPARRGVHAEPVDTAAPRLPSTARSDASGARCRRRGTTRRARPPARRAQPGRRSRRARRVVDDQEPETG